MPWEQQIEYWKSKLAGAPAVLTLPTDRWRPAERNFRAAASHFVLSDALCARLSELGKGGATTLSTVLVAAFAVLLSRYSNQQEVLIGVPSGQCTPNLEAANGVFGNIAVLRVDLSGNPTFLQLLQQVTDATAEAQAHNAPFEKIVEAIHTERDSSRHPLVQTCFAFWQASDQMPTRSGGDPCEVEPADATTNFDLELRFRAVSSRLSGSLQYASELFEYSSIERMVGHYRRLLDDVAGDPSRGIGVLSLLSQQERQRQLTALHGPTVLHRRGDCLHDLFIRQAATTPDATALYFEERTMSYAELNRRSNKLAHHLRKLSVRPDIIVGLCVERSLEMVVGLLGIMKAGGAYLPLDPNYPKQRLAYMLDDARAPVLVTQAALLRGLPTHDAEVVRIDADWEEIERQPSTPVDSRTLPGNLAYVVYTSGSTGRPKGVMIPHAGIVNRLLWMDETYRLSTADRVLHKTPLSFDVSVWEIMWPLIAGAGAVLARSGGHSDSSYLAALIAAQGVTVAHFLPTMLRTFLEMGAFNDCTSLREVLCGGETLPFDTVRAFLANGRAALSNIYGPTEASIGMTCWRGTMRADGIVPIGRPIANARAYVLDAWLEPVPTGVAGELYIGGIPLARGYLHQPALTAEKFVPNPFEEGQRLYRTGDLVRLLPDGNLAFLGRIDQQVKVRGYRIELDEIEGLLASCPGVSQAAVAAREDVKGGKRLVGYVVPSAQAPSAQELRAYLRTKLPDYMIPSAFVTLKALPQTPNGKIDRNGLPAPKPQTGEYVPPRDDIELAVQRLWQQVIGLAPIGIKDDFFELGGHSLLGASLIEACNRLFKIRLPSSVLFNCSTVETLADAIRQKETLLPYCPLVPLQKGGGRRSLFCIHAAGGSAFRYMALAGCLGADQPVYGLQASGLEPGEPLAPSVEAMAAAYIEAIRAVQPQGPYRLLGWSFGGLVAYEMASQLKRSSETIALLTLLDTPRPWSAQSARMTEREIIAALANQMLGPKDAGDDEREKIRSLAQLVEAARGRGFVSPDFSVAQAERMAVTLANAVEIGRAYRPPRLRQDLIYFRATKPSEYARQPAELFDWSPLLDRAPVTIAIPCNHLEMGSPRYAPAIADALRPRLAESLEDGRCGIPAGGNLIECRSNA